MENPFALHSQEKTILLGKIFNAPLVIKDKNWFPWTEIFAALVFGVLSFVQKSERRWWQHIGIGLAKTGMTLGAEWGHNLAHAAAAKIVDRPTSAIRVVYGLPLLNYYGEQESRVTPRQHIVRALGGPIFNLCSWIGLTVIRFLTHPQGAKREILDTGIWMNRFLATLSLLPIPMIDGDPIMRNLLVMTGKSPQKAEEIFRTTNIVLGGGLAGASLVALFKKSWFWSGFLALLSYGALTFGLEKVIKKRST